MANTVTINLNDYESMMQEFRFYKNVVDSIVNTVSANSWNLEYYKDAGSYLDIEACPGQYLSAPDKDRLNGMIDKSVQKFIEDNNLSGEIMPKGDFRVHVCELKKVHKEEAPDANEE